MDGRAKRRRQPTPDEQNHLQHLLNIGGTSNRSLRKILEDVRASDSDFNYSIREALDGAFHARFQEVALAVDLPLKGEGSFRWEFADPGLLLAKMVRECPALASVYLAAIRESPPGESNPWHLILAWDEFAPGDKLHTDNRRKCMVLSFSFRELGQSTLSHDFGHGVPHSSCEPPRLGEFVADGRPC